jgi:hypothetical protein
MSLEVYEDHGLRFEYPSGWDLEVSEQDEVTTVAVQAPGEGLAFALVTTDSTRPDPEAVADEALEAMREEYPGLDSNPAIETINEHCTTGHDIEFMALDLTNAARIRCFRTPRRTVLIFGQWSDLGEEFADDVLNVFQSMEELED